MNGYLKTQRTGRSFFQVISFIFVLTLISCSDDSSTPLAREPVIYMWVSTTTTDGKIEGQYSGADSICQKDAAGIDFPSLVESHRAILSGPGQDARTLFDEDDDRPVKRPDADATLIIDSYAKFFDRSENLENDITETTDHPHYWTGVGDEGEPGGDACNDWSDNGPSRSSSIGRTENSIRFSYRLKYSTGNSCFVENALLCVSN